MNIVVTGGAGAVGSYLCMKLLQEGHTVLCLDNLLTGRKENLENFKDDPNFYYREVDVSNERNITDYIADADLVYHLAGSVGVMLVDKDPMGCLTNNLETGQAVFKVAARYGVKVLYTSSSEVYGNGYGSPFKESDTLQIGSPEKMRWSYASSKLTQEFLAKGYSDKNVVVRLFNIVSDRHKKSYVVPSFSQKALAGDPITVYGDGKAVRCLCHVEDAVEYLYRLGIDDTANGQTFNIGNDDIEIQIGSLAHKVVSHLKSSSVINFVDYEEVFSGQHDDINYRRPNVDKVQKHTGYTPQKKLEDILDLFHE